MMGRSPSHMTLECANLTQPNVALIGEEVEAKRMTLAEVVGELADTVELRAREGRPFGIVLIPEGLLEFIPQVNSLTRTRTLTLTLTLTRRGSSSSYRR
jgi:pyrophosphate--fructose-6-phosphate 1-phosphotransferase